MSTAVTEISEIKTKTTPEIKKHAANIYSKWGLSLSDAINIFLVKSVEVGGLPFEMRDENSLYAALREKAYKPGLNSDGVVVLPRDWDDDDNE